MEVHHHPQLEHKPKPWKEYLLEYFMIFLAVMTGFFAESYREHLGDRGKETEYMRSMVQDLKADTAEVKLTEMRFEGACRLMDTMLTCLKSDNPDPAVINKAISHTFWLYTGFNYNDHTVQQLKSSGNFRLVRNTAVADSILKYDSRQTAFLLNQYNDLKGTLMTYKNIEAKVVFYKQLKGVDYDEYNKTDFAPTDKPVFITKDKALIASYYNSLFTHEALCFTFLRSLKSSYRRASRLIDLIKREYKLDDE